jgi:hypothetical protein
VSSACANGLEPYAYLNYVLENLPAADTVEVLEALLPWNVESILRANRIVVARSSRMTRTFKSGDARRFRFKRLT